MKCQDFQVTLIKLHFYVDKESHETSIEISHAKHPASLINRHKVDRRQILYDR